MYMSRIGSLEIISSVEANINLKLGAQTPHAIAIGEGPNNPLNWAGPLGTGQILVGVGGADPIPGNIVGTGGVSVSIVGGLITISGSSSPFSWVVAQGALNPMVPNTGYIA